MLVASTPNIDNKWVLTMVPEPIQQPSLVPFGSPSVCAAALTVVYIGARSPAA